MIKEEWRDIVGYEGLYAVSNCGRVKSLERVDSLGRRVNERILSLGKDRYGYLFVDFCKCGKSKRYSVHRLVLMTFNPCPDSESLQVNHLDENKENNNLSNLEWTTHENNINYGTRNDRAAEKKSIPIVQIDPSTNKIINVWGSSMAAEREGGFTNQNITACCKGRRKTHGGYRWMYLKDWLKEHNKGIPKKLYFID